tara:strand:- start:992 stop:1129 length:138 start_codon:yes stop_codon:yes gene_type:complete
VVVLQVLVEILILVHLQAELVEMELQVILQDHVLQELVAELVDLF